MYQISRQISRKLNVKKESNGKIWDITNYNLMYYLWKEKKKDDKILKIYFFLFMQLNALKDENTS